MATSPLNATPNPGLPAMRVYLIASVCLLVGLVVGYTFLGKAAAPTVVQPAATSVSGTAPSMANHPKPTLEQMKQMADVQASALIENSKSDPKSVRLMTEIASIYQAAHQFKEAIDYYGRALSNDPKNAQAGTQLASCLYYSGDVDGAVEELNEVLKSNPKDINALFNLGMIKYRGKNDNAGAVAAWEQLLKTNPNLDRRSMVEQLIAEAKSAPAPKNEERGNSVRR